MPKLPPDPDDMNNARSGWAASALYTFQAITHCDPEDAFGDLLVNLHHYADRHNIDMKAALEKAARAYADETAET